RLLDPFRSGPAHATDHGVGRATLRGLPLRRPLAVDVLCHVVAVRGVGDPRERAARQEGAYATPAAAGGERAVGARQFPPELRGAPRDPRSLSPAVSRE